MACKPPLDWLHPVRRSACVLVACGVGLLAPNTLAQSANPSRLPSMGDAGEMSLVAERRMGDGIMREIYKDPDYLDDPVLGSHVETIWRQLMQAAQTRGELSPELVQRLAWEVNLIRDPSVNAFALPGGYLGVHLGLIATVANRHELASVMAHELTHVTQRHISRIMSRQSQQSPILMGAMLLAILAASRNPTAGSAMISGGQAVAMQTQLNFSRDMEREADRVGYGVMADAGFDTLGFVSMFEKLQQASRLNDRGNYPYLRSHPLTSERIADMQLRQSPQGAHKLAPADWDDVLAASRARALMQSTPDGYRRLTDSASAPDFDYQTPQRQAALLYAAVLADVKLKNASAALNKLAKLEPLLRNSAPTWWRWLQAEVALQMGQPKLALQVMLPATTSNVRADVVLLAQARLASGLAAERALGIADLDVWLLSHPRDATAWGLLAALLEQQGERLRSVRALAQQSWVHADVLGAVDRLKAAQALVQQKTREGSMGRADNIEASIIDANLRELESLRREQLLQR